MTVETERPESAQVPHWQLWFSLAAGPLVWMLHLMIVYPITSLTCEWGWFPFTVLGLSGLQFVQLVVTIVAAVIVLGAGIIAFNNWRVLRASVPDHTPEAARYPFMAYVAILMNALFFLAIIVAIVPILTLDPCAR